MELPRGVKAAQINFPEERASPSGPHGNGSLGLGTNVE